MFHDATALLWTAVEPFCNSLNKAVALGLPSLTVTSFPLHKAVHALRHLARQRSWANVVVTQPLVADGEGVYLITGGLGYLGRLTAKALMVHGARRVVLVSSRAAEVPADWDGPFAPVVERCDVGDAEAVGALVGRWPGLKGVIHAAGVLADRTVAQLTAADFERVYRPKVLGARHLHECTQGKALDFFVLFSSIASGMGSAGQANYAAANGCLDALALKRRAQGLPALSVRWGAWPKSAIVFRIFYLDLSIQHFFCALSL